MSLRASWEQTTENLLAARSLLDVPEDLLREFAEYLEHHELEQVLEMGAPDRVWRKALKKRTFSIMRGVTATGSKGRARVANNQFEADGLAFRCALGRGSSETLAFM